MLTKLAKIKKVFRTSRQIQQDEWDKPYKEITDRHFNSELIDWNVQTCMYDLLTNIIFNIDEVHLKTIAKSYKDGWNECIEVQLRDAIKDVLKSKKLL